ncbi:hypothetical protein FOCC_FOCC011428, partial [Frankliniella occidentalis]
MRYSGLPSGLSAVPDGLSVPAESAIMSRLFSMSAVNAVNNSEPTSASHRYASSASVDWQEYNNSGLTLPISSTTETILNSTPGIALKSTPRVVASSTSTPGHSRTAAFSTSGTTTGTGDSNAAQTFSSTPSSTNVVPGSGITTVGEPSSTTKSATEKIREFVLCYSEER